MKSVPYRQLNIFLGLALSLALTSACSTTPTATTAFDATQLRPEANERVKVDRALLLVDASGSIDSRTQFPDAKALVESFVQGMPEGRYDTGVIAFGGTQRDSLRLAPFARSTVAGKVSSVSHLGEDTPLPTVLDEARSQLAGTSGHTAIVMFTDGLPSVASREQPADWTLAAARRLLRSQSGLVCFHTVQVGDDPAGTALLRQLAELTPCGSIQSANAIQNGSDLLIAQRHIFMGSALPAVAAAAPRDADRDGVADNRDNCPRTPRGAEVDKRGCWVLIGLNFALDSSAIDSQGNRELDDVARILRENPDVRIRIDGHTDSLGEASYNQALSERRARALQTHLESVGIDPSRMDSRGHGETDPIADNSTRQGQAINRRAQLTRID